MIFLDLSKDFNITVQVKDSFPKKIYNSSFSLDRLKNKSKFFKIYDSFSELLNDLKTMLEQKSFFIKSFEKSLAFCIKKQIGISNDIIFPLKEKSSDINEVVEELCKKSLNLEKRVEELENEIKRINKELKIIKKNKLSRITQFFDKEIKNINLVFKGFDRKEFFESCNGKNNLLFLVKDNNNNKFGGFMSSKLIENKGNDINIKDENAFIFSLQKKKSLVY